MSIEQSTTYPKASQASATAGTSIVSTLLPIVAAVFVAYLVIGLALPVIPLQVYKGLGTGVHIGIRNDCCRQR